MKTKLILLGGILFLVFGCSKERKPIEISGEEISIIPLEDSLFLAKNMMDIQQTLVNHYPMSSAYFLIDSNSVHLFSDVFYSMILNENLKGFYLDSKKPAFFGNKQWKKDLNDFFGRTKTLYPDKPIPKIYTIFSGFGGGGNFSAPALMINDSILVIGLDYYMGPKGRYVAPEIYDYQLRKYSPEAMVSQIALEYAGMFNRHKKSKVNLLSDMIWAGKNYYFTKQVLPQTADSTLFGYTSKEIKETEQFEATIWEHFIEKSLLYKSDELTKTKYMGDRPKTLEVGPACPGSIGRWLGYRIVRAYMDNHPEVSVQELMEDTDTEKIFRESGYRAKKE